MKLCYINYLMNNNNKIKKYDKIRYLYEQKYLHATLVANERHQLINLIQFQKKQSAKQHHQIHQRLKEAYKSQLGEKDDFFQFCQTDGPPRLYQSMKSSHKSVVNPKVVQIKYEKIMDASKKGTVLAYVEVKNKKGSLEVKPKIITKFQQCQSTRQKYKNKSMIVNLSKYNANTQKKKYSIINLIKQLRSRQPQKSVIFQNIPTSKSIKQIHGNDNNLNPNLTQKIRYQSTLKNLSFTQRSKRYSLSRRHRKYKVSSENSIGKCEQLLKDDCSKQQIEPWMVKNNQEQSNWL